MKAFVVLFFGFISLVRLNAQPIDSKPEATVQAIFLMPSRNVPWEILTGLWLYSKRQLNKNQMNPHFILN